MLFLHVVRWPQPFILVKPAGFCFRPEALSLGGSGHTGMGHAVSGGQRCHHLQTNYALQGGTRESGRVPRLPTAHRRKFRTGLCGPFSGPVWQSRVANFFPRKQIHSKARRLNVSAPAFLYELGSPGRWARAKLDDIQRNKRLRPKRNC